MPFTPPTAPFAPDAHTLALCHFDSDSPLVDETGKALAISGSGAISATEAKFGGESLYCPTGDAAGVLYTPDSGLGLGSGDWTIEMFTYAVDWSDIRVFADARVDYSGTGWLLYFDGTQFRFFEGSSAIGADAAPPTLN